MLNIFIALLIEKGVLEEAEGKALIEKLRTATLPGDFNSSRKLVQKYLMQIKKDAEKDLTR